MATVGNNMQKVADYEYDNGTTGDGTLTAVTSIPGGGAIVNQIQREYNGLFQPTVEYQAHDGAVDTSTTPKVQYGYDTIANGSRMTSMIYPNGRVLNYNYAGGLDSTVGRLSSITNGSTTLESYTYFGLGTVVERSHPENGVNLTYIGTGTSDAGDQYTGLDRFGRIVDQNWTNGTTSVDRYGYTYDRDSNRTSKDNALHTAIDKASTYDTLGRLTEATVGRMVIVEYDLSSVAFDSSLLAFDLTIVAVDLK